MDTAEARDTSKMGVTLMVVALVFSAAITLLVLLLRFFNAFHEDTLASPAKARNQRMMVLTSETDVNPVPVQTVRNTLAEYDTMDLWYVCVCIKRDSNPVNDIYKYFTYMDYATFSDNFAAAGVTPPDSSIVDSSALYIDHAVTSLNVYGSNRCLLDYKYSDDNTVSSLTITVLPYNAGE